MIKHYCDKCGKELKEITRIVFCMRGNFSCAEKSVEFCEDCIINAFGKNFVDEIIAERKEREKKRERMKAERAAAREAKG